MNKGVITKVLPLDEMPRDSKGVPFDIIINPTGVISRKNSGQLIELYQGRIIKHVNNLVMHAIKERKYKSALSEILKMNKLINPNKKYVSELSEIFKKLLKSNDKLESYIASISEAGVPLVIDPVKKHDINNIVNAMNEYGIKTKEKIYDPSIGGKTKTSVSYGYMYWSKAEHMSEFKYHARSRGMSQAATGQAVKGSKNEGGQRVGELDMFALLSYDVNNYIAELSTLSSDDIKSKNQALGKIYTQGNVSIKDLRDIKSSSSEQLKSILQGMGLIEV